MKKLIVASLLAAGALAGVPAMADAECQAGSGWGVKEGCGGPTQRGVPMPTPEPNVYNNSGWTPPGTGNPYAYGNRPYTQVVPQYQEQRRPDRRGERRFDREEQRQLSPSRRDRDGDGVVNRQDRHPGDPSRR